jgi:selenophosphate synthetase-related protein
LFGEDAGRVVVSCDPGNVARIQEIAQEHDISAELLGETIPAKLEIRIDSRTIISATLTELGVVYEDALEAALQIPSGS